MPEETSRTVDSLGPGIYPSEIVQTLETPGEISGAFWAKGIEVVVERTPAPATDGPRGRG